MSFRVGTLSLTSALVSLPLSGAWTAELALSPLQGDAAAAASGAITVELNGLTLSGFVVRSDAVDGAIHVRVVGGNGKLSTTVQERFYRGASTVRKIVTDILRDCGGETLSADSSATVLDTQLSTWQRASESAGGALSRIVESLGGNWRVTPDGDILVTGGESWPIVAPPHTLVTGSDGAAGVYRVAWPGATPDEILPGVTFRGMRIRYVSHELTAGSLRTEVRTQEPREQLAKLREFMARGEWYSRLWPAVVDRQNADGSVDVVVAGRWGETAVKLRHGLPGVTVLVAQGQQVLIGYEQDDPKRPFAALWTASGTAKVGTLLLAQNAASLALLPPQWFSAGSAGNAAAVAALAVVLGAGNVGYLLPLTMPLVEVI
jgi:hypothetical protein